MQFVHLVFVVTFLISLSSAAAFSLNVETLMLNGHEKSGESYSLLFDDSSPGIQEGNNVRFVKAGSIHIILNALVFEVSNDTCIGKEVEICYDADLRDGRQHFSCLPSQCSLKLYVEDNASYLFDNATWEHKGEGTWCTSFPLTSSAEACMLKTENGMIQAMVIQYACLVIAKDSQIKYPEIPSSSLAQKFPQNHDESASASIWYNIWWLFIVIIVCVCLALILGGAAAILFFYLMKKRNSVKAPPSKETIAIRQTSLVMPNADLPKKLKNNEKKKTAAEKSIVTKNAQKAEKKAAAEKKVSR